jgi:GH43 family beta-xylosidase
MSNKTIANVDTPDPWMIAANGVFYLTFTLGNRISIWESPLMEDFFEARKSIIWQPEKGSPWSADVWAPELHWLNGAWYIYATASHPGVGNRGHRTIVLRSTQQDPMEKSGWEFLGPVKGMPEQFSIDATVFSPNGQDLYICWSGWPPGDYSDTQQNLYIAQMVSPEEIVSEDIMPPACISSADQPWERFQGGKRGINEGPTWLNLPNGAFTGIVFSGHASFTSEYKLGLLRLASPNADPLDPKSWIKRPIPLLVNDKSMPGPYAPGHASFLLSPEPGDNRIFCIYHATENWGEGFKNRKARVMVMSPSDFDDRAQPLCCSHAPHNPTWTGVPGQRPSVKPQQQGGPGITQRLDQYAQKAPAPVQKALDKFKKFL